MNLSNNYYTPLNAAINPYNHFYTPRNTGMNLLNNYYTSLNTAMNRDDHSYTPLNAVTDTRDTLPGRQVLQLARAITCNPPPAEESIMLTMSRPALCSGEFMRRSTVSFCGYGTTIWQDLLKSPIHHLNNTVVVAVFSGFAALIPP